MKLIKNISNELNVPSEMLYEAIGKSRKLVKHIKMEKRDGSERTVFQPSKKLKMIQYWLINNIFINLRIHASATAFINEKSIKTNATLHRENRYFLKLDFKDFFPSLAFDDLHPIIVKWLADNDVSLNEEELSEVIRLTCFYKKDMLPIGYPSSPIISNIIMYDFDSFIHSALSSDDKYGEARYTRYADDLTFSTKKKGACNNIMTLVRNKLKKMSSPKLKLNNKKTTFASSSGGSALITGLRICHDGHMTIHRKYKDKVRLLLSLYKKEALDESDVHSLKGHLAYIRHVDGRFYTKMQSKYFKTIERLIAFQ